MIDFHLMPIIVLLILLLNSFCSTLSYALLLYYLILTELIKLANEQYSPIIPSGMSIPSTSFTNDVARTIQIINNNYRLDNYNNIYRRNIIADTLYANQIINDPYAYRFSNIRKSKVFQTARLNWQNAIQAYEQFSLTGFITTLTKNAIMQPWNTIRHYFLWQEKV